MRTENKPAPYAWEDHDANRQYDLTEEHRKLAELVATDPTVYGPRMIAAFAGQIRAACLLQSQPLAKSMEDAAKSIAEATGGQMSGRMQFEISHHPKVLSFVRFTASTGDSMKKGTLGYRSEWGDTPEMAAAALIDDLHAARVSEKIRVHFLRERAQELGYTIVKADGSKAEG